MSRYESGDGQSLPEELGRLREFSRQPTFPLMFLEVLYAAPAIASAGMIVYADGTTWNPGAGEGVYRYSLGGAWVHLG